VKEGATYEGKQHSCSSSDERTTWIWKGAKLNSLTTWDFAIYMSSLTPSTQVNSSSEFRYVLTVGLDMTQRSSASRSHQTNSWHAHAVDCLVTRCHYRETLLVASVKGKERTEEYSSRSDQCKQELSHRSIWCWPVWNRFCDCDPSCTGSTSLPSTPQIQPSIDRDVLFQLRSWLPCMDDMHALGSWRVVLLLNHPAGTGSPSQTSSSDPIHLESECGRFSEWEKKTYDFRRPFDRVHRASRRLQIRTS
jgi:hypothetical protein